MAETSEETPSSPPERDVRPQRPRAAPPQPAWPEPPNAWQKNPQGLVMLFVLMNLALFLYACTLFSRLTTGQYWLLTLSGPEQGAPLGQFMLEPISIYQVPMQGLVMALLLTVFIAGPVLMAQFLGRGWAVLFIVPLIPAAHLPLLALAMLGATMLANAHVLGVGNRFVRGVVALALPVAALWISTAWTEAIFKSPMERFCLHFPWIGAILLSILVMMLFWPIARLLRYRAGLGTVALGLLVAVTAAVFNYGVGMDELAFRLLASDYGLDSPRYFRSGPLTKEIDALTEQRLLEDGIDNPTRQELAGCRGEVRTWLAMRASTELNDSREAVSGACRGLLDRFGDSRYVPYLRFLLARSQDMRVSLPSISREERIHYYEDVVSEAGRDNWERLLVYYPDHPLAVIARVRLAQWYLAQGNIDGGYRLMRDAHKRLREVRPPGTGREPFSTQPWDPVTQPIIEERTKQVPAWLWLIERNRGEGPLGDEPLSKLFALDPHQFGYLDKLDELRHQYKGSHLADNLELLIRLQERHVSRRIRSLREFIAARTDARSDARYQAMADLANLLVKQDSPTCKEEARRLWRELIASGEKLFADEARQGLFSIGEPLLPPPPATRPRSAEPPAETSGGN